MFVYRFFIFHSFPLVKILTALIFLSRLLCYLHYGHWVAIAALLACPSSTGPSTSSYRAVSGVREKPISK